MVNKSLNPQNTHSSNNTSTLSIESVKRKFQRVNQEVVKQNVTLHEQAARLRQDNHRLLQDNVKLKGRKVALESKLREVESRSIADRIDILEAIGEHLINVTKFLRILSSSSSSSASATNNTNTNNTNIDNTNIDTANINTASLHQSIKVKGPPSLMLSIPEEDVSDMVISEIEDVSINN